MCMLLGIAALWLAVETLIPLMLKQSSFMIRCLWNDVDSVAFDVILRLFHVLPLIQLISLNDVVELLQIFFWFTLLFGYIIVLWHVNKHLTHLLHLAIDVIRKSVITITLSHHQKQSRSLLVVVRIILYTSDVFYIHLIWFNSSLRSESKCMLK